MRVWYEPVMKKCGIKRPRMDCFLEKEENKEIISRQRRKAERMKR